MHPEDCGCAAMPPKPSSTCPDTQNGVLRHACPLTRVTKAANNQPVKFPHAPPQETIVGYRRVIVVLALAAWTLARLSCPIPESGSETALTEESPAFSSHAAHDEHFGTEAPVASGDHHHTDECCQVLSTVKAISGPIAAHSSFKSNASSLPVPVLVMLEAPAPALQFTKLTPHSNGPPAERYRRFATFWPHAPPADRI